MVPFAIDTVSAINMRLVARLPNDTLKQRVEASRLLGAKPIESISISLLTLCFDGSTETALSKSLHRSCHRGLARSSADRSFSCAEWGPSLGPQEKRTLCCRSITEDGNSFILPRSY